MADFIRPRTSSPVSESENNKSEWLYVPDAEIPEALALGARMIEGDGRLIIPSPFPPGINRAAFARWQTDQARYKWCLKTVISILGDRVAITDPDVLIAGMFEGAVTHERVYLYVPSYDVMKVRNEPGVQWDRRCKMFYALPDADLSRLFLWLTPASRQTWEAERTVHRTLTLLVQNQARAEVSSSSSNGEGNDRKRSDARFIKPPSRGLS